MSFVIPKEEKWIKQVLVADQCEVNIFLLEKADNKAFRGFTIMGMSNALILLAYEENVNAEKTTDQ